MIETEQQSRAWSRAARFGAKMSCDEFMQWYHDPDVRRRIFSAAKLCEDNVNTAKDLRQDAWAEICQLHPCSARKEVMKAAHRAITRVWMRDSRRKKKVTIILDPEL
jgi:hypothetical protein